MLKFCITLITLIQFSALGYSQTIESSITRTQVVFGETFELIVKVGSQSGLDKLHKPDFDSLREDFEFLETTIEEYEAGLVTEYWITLLPNRVGKLTVPELHIGIISSNFLTIEVVSANQLAPSIAQELIFESSVDNNIAYVQEELELTLRLFYLIQGISSMSFTEIAIENADVQLPSAPNQYLETVNGTRYGVYETKQIIVPLKSGQLEIPNILFRGEVVSAGNFAAPDVRNDEKVSAFAEGLTITVIDRSR